MQHHRPATARGKVACMHCILRLCEEEEDSKYTVGILPETLSRVFCVENSAVVFLRYMVGGRQKYHGKYLAVFETEVIAFKAG